MASSLLYPSTMADDGGANGGTVAWSNPNNAKTENGTSATCDMTAGDEIGNVLIASNFGFSIPGGSSIDGIMVEWKASEQSSTGTSNNYSQVLVKHGESTIRTPDTGTTTSSISGTLTYYSAGGATDLWGTTWTTSDVNGANFQFGVAITNNAQPDPGDVVNIDVMRVTVYYTLGIVTTTQTIPASSDILNTTTKTANASSRIQVTVDKTLNSRANVFGTNSNEFTAHARVKRTYTNNLSSRASVIYTRQSRTISSLATIEGGTTLNTYLQTSRNPTDGELYHPYDPTSTEMILVPEATYTTSGYTGAAKDFDASFSGVVDALGWIDITSGTVTVKLQDSPNGSSGWVDIPGLTDTRTETIDYFGFEINPGDIQQYIRAVVTFSGGTDFRMILLINHGV